MRPETKFIIVILVVIAIIAAYFAGALPMPRKTVQVSKTSRVKTITEKLEIPNTNYVAAIEGRIVSKGQFDIPLAPKNDSERFIVPNADLTVKESFAFTEPIARQWSPDAKLVFIKSLGAITLDGRSSQWQVIFHSAKTKKGYEIIIRGKSIISKKEIESDAEGAEPPKNWYDSGDAIKSLQSLPQFGGATASAISFSYSADSKKWLYVLATSRGTTSMPVN